MTNIPLARKLRQSQTEAEKSLWRVLRDRQLSGYKFRRQHPIGPYVVDFVCLNKALIIEADGGQHAESPHDQTRDRWLHQNGYRVLRFWNNEILENHNGVMLKILEYLTCAP